MFDDHKVDYHSKKSTAVGDHVATLVGSLSGGFLGYEAICKIMTEIIGKQVNINTLVTTEEALIVLGSVPIAQILGGIAGFYAHEYIKDKQDEYGFFKGIYMAAIGSPVEKLVKLIGNTKATVQEKARQIANGINQMAQQIVDKVKNKSINKNDENTLSK